MNEEEFQYRVSFLIKNGISREQAEKEIVIEMRNRRISRSLYYASRYRRCPPAFKRT